MGGGSGNLEEGTEFRVRAFWKTRGAWLRSELDDFVGQRDRTTGKMATHSSQLVRGGPSTHLYGMLPQSTLATQPAEQARKARRKRRRRVCGAMRSHKRAREMEAISPMQERINARNRRSTLCWTLRHDKTPVRPHHHPDSHALCTTASPHHPHQLTA